MNPTYEKFSRLLNRKVLLGLLALILMLVFICVSSFVPFIITKEKLGTARFWTDELIIVGITVFATLATMFIAKASNAQDPRSEISKARVEFMTSKERIKKQFSKFFQWVKKVLQPNDIQAIKERELRNVGITDYSVLLLEDSDVEQLRTISINKPLPGTYEDHFYSKLNNKQCDKILKLKDGIKKKLVEPQYYLTAKSLGADKTISEQSGNENIKKTFILALSLVSKIILTLMFAVIIGALARDLSEGAGGDAAQKWITFLARMFALITSMFLGWLVGCQSNDIEAEYLRLRVTVHDLYLEDTGFVPDDDQEIARQEYMKDHALVPVTNP